MLNNGIISHAIQLDPTLGVLEGGPERDVCRVVDLLELLPVRVAVPGQPVAAHHLRQVLADKTCTVRLLNLTHQCRKCSSIYIIYSFQETNVTSSQH